MNMEGTFDTKCADLHLMSRPAAPDGARFTRDAPARRLRPLATLCTTAVLAAASAGALADGPRYAQHADTAPVIAARPLYQQVVEPKRRCTREVITTTVPGHARVDIGGLAGPVIGAVAGGVIGSQVGGGSGRTAATVAGAVAGTIAGSMIGPPPGGGSVVYPVAHPVDRVVERCHTVNHVRNVVSGYEVTYRYHGRNFTTLMPYDPGRFVQVGVTQAQGKKHRAGRRDGVRGW